MSFHLVPHLPKLVGCGRNTASVTHIQKLRLFIYRLDDAESDKTAYEIYYAVHADKDCKNSISGS